MLLFIFLLHAALHGSKCEYIYSIYNAQRTDDNFPVSIPTQTTELQLSSNQFTRIESEALYGLGNVTWASIQDNNLISFPNLTYMAASLKLIYLRGNAISYVNAEYLNMLTAIEILGLEENALSSIPDVPGPSDTLNILSLYNNQFHTFPVLNQLGRSLIQLTISYNLFSEVPPNTLMLGQDNGGQVLEFQIGPNTNLMSLPPIITADPDSVEVNLDGILLNCDENVAWMVSLKHTAQFYNFVCDQPAHLNGKLLSELTIDDLVTETAIRQKLAEKTFTNIYSNTMPLVRTTVKSRTACAVLCARTAGCLYFNYNAVEGTIHCHYADPVNGMFYNDYGVDTPGWMYYSIK